jgi:ubiquinone/menaquinone biosynthesis C-methylase UbiE
MGIYTNRILPTLIDLSMRNKELRPYRERIVGAAEGRVLEIGIGSGRNLVLYPARVERVIGLDPSPQLLAMAREAARGTPRDIELLEGSAAAIPLDRASVDTVVSTWSLCSITNAPRALGEMLRVLKPGGRFLFVEHGRAPDAGVRWWQDRLTPIWKRVGGGCHLNRSIGELIEGAGFHIERLETGYMRRRNPMAFMYEGSARPR